MKHEGIREIDPAFEVVRPVGGITNPVLVNSPHSGRDYPASFIAGSRLDETTLRRSEDFLVDELFAAAGAVGSIMLKANFPRAYIDVNREPYELDPDMFDDALPHFVNTTSLRVASGLGTIARLVSEEHEIYRRKLNWREAEARIGAYYHPYHRTLHDLIEEVHGRFGFALLLDCHSMPASAARAIGGGRAVDVILGDHHGTCCAGEIVDAVHTLFAEEGFKVGRNRPYAGGYITQTYGHPRRQRSALQIEINRGLYMDERTIERSAGFTALADAIARVLAGLVSWLDTLGEPGSLAAE